MIPFVVVEREINPIWNFQENSKDVMRRPSKIFLHIHTSDSYGLICLFPSSQEDDILLRSIDVVILEEEDFVHSMVLKSRKIDEYLYWTCK